MSRATVRAVVFAVLVAAGLGVSVIVSPGAPGLTVEIYLFVAAGLAVAVVLLGIANTLPRREPAPIEQPPRSQRIGHGQLESVARALDLAEASSFDLHNVLRPIVREVAAARLARHGVSLDREPERARALLGAPTWELVRADREAPGGRSGRGGCSREELREIVGALEAI